MSPKELVEGVIQQGHAVNQSQFGGSNRCGVNAFGGNAVFLDFDDGTTFEQIKATPTYQQWGVAITPSCSSGVTSAKPGVDGQERHRVILLCARPFHTDKWTEDEDELKLNQKRQHFERVAITDTINTNICAEIGIPRMKDECFKTVSQAAFGNDGVSLVRWKTPEGIYRFYPCSTDRRVSLNDGCMSLLEMGNIIQAYRRRHPEIFNPVQRRTSEELSADAELVRWLFDNDVYDEKVLCDYDTYISLGMGAKGMDESLLDSFITTMERYADHYWRTEPEIIRRWDQYSNVSEVGIGTFIHHANQCDPSWRERCPLVGGSSLPKLSNTFNLLTSNRGY